MAAPSSVFLEGCVCWGPEGGQWDLRGPCVEGGLAFKGMASDTGQWLPSSGLRCHPVYSARWP